MTRERAKELAPIIQAFGEGKCIQFKNRGDDEWNNSNVDIDADYGFWEDKDYRIAPEPRTRPMTRGEVAFFLTTTNALVVRNSGRNNEMYLPGDFPCEYANKYEYAIIDKSGNPVDGWHKFEVEE